MRLAPRVSSALCWALGAALGVAGAADLSVCSVEPMSGIRRTGTKPDDGDFSDPLRIIAAGGEYEPGSLMLMSEGGARGVMVEPGELKGPDGAVLPASAFDVKIVKVWYQQGSAWGSFFSDPLRRVETPELLLHDDDLVRVDRAERENFLRCDESDGTRYRWISFEGAVSDHTPDGAVLPKWVHDADSLRPFALEKGVWRQLFVTVHVPCGQAAGVYCGEIAVSVGGVRAATFPVAVRVLPFDLPQPRTLRDLSRPFMCVPYVGNMSPADNPKIARSMSAHNVRNYIDLRGISTRERAEAVKRAHEESGLDNSRLFAALPRCNLKTSYPADPSDSAYGRHVAARASVSNAVTFLRDVFGPDVRLYSYGIDEGSAATVRQERDTWRMVHGFGGRTMTASHYHPYLLFNLDFPIVPRAPRHAKRAVATDIHTANPEALVGWYADPHAGPENPDYARRLYGWLTWRNDYDCSAQYILFRDNWNDFYVSAEPLIRGIVLVYPADGAVLDTLQYEGLREGMDDVRYLTYLRELIAEARGSADVETAYAARAAATWIAQVDCEHAALDALRLEAISRILDLRRRLGKEVRK